jgi:KUP system potassium uptake protein
VQKPEATGTFLAHLNSEKIARVPGTAVFFSRSDIVVPAVLVHHVAQMKALQETVVSLTIRFEEFPRVFPDQRIEVEKIAEGFWHVTIRFGFIEKPNVAAALASAREKGCPVHLDDAVYFASHDDIVRNANAPRLPAWRRMLFAVMYRNAVRAPDRFELPPDKFVEVGRQIAL